MKKLKSLFLLSVFSISTFVTLESFSKSNSIEIVSSTQSSNTKFENDKFNIVFENYLDLNKALVSSDNKAAKENAKKLLASLTAFNAKKSLINLASKISNESDIEVQRRYSLQLNTLMIELTKTQKLKSGAAYVAFCPMADNNNGGYWLTDENAIKNPYFGSKMLKCGKIKETIK